ncbi:UNVERIFIED_CONTAM: Copia protein [Sesamum latifolium]|uniref:Copia protein n=1 Tax=Sesamum latifolium TaxID=2727402 RepID=A0AAW2XHR6_9LAMI
MQPPEGYPVPPGQVCRHKRSLYGLKQTSRQWNQEFTDKLQTYDFVQSSHDYCLFTKVTSLGLFALLVYVDDVLIAGPSEIEIQNIKQYLDELFTIKDLGSAKYFLGLELARSAQGLILTQTKYIKDLVSETGLSNARATTTPLPTGIKFSAGAGNPIAEPEQLSQFLQSPCQQHWDAAMHLVKYLKGTPYKVVALTAFSLDQPSSPGNQKAEHDITVNR